MVLEEEELGARDSFKVLEWLILLTLASLLVPMVLERLELNALLPMVLERLDIDVSSPLREAVFLLPWWLVGGYIAACDGLHCLHDGFCKGYLFSGLHLATRGGWECYMVYGCCGCQIRDLK